MKIHKLAAIAALLLVGSMSSAHAQFQLIFEIDENGHGEVFVPSLGVVGSLSSYLAPDPGPGGLSSVLTYDLGYPPSLVVGDVQLTENGLPLDVIRFNAADASNGTPAAMLFYSDNIDGYDSLADTVSPPLQYYSNLVSIPEIGAESSNGAIYTPGANDPGFVGGYDITYIFVSDAVPEPGTIALLLSSVSIPLLALRRLRILRE